MKYRNHVNAIVAAAAISALGACSDPTAPGVGESPDQVRFANQAALGSYQIFFMIESRTGLISVDNSAPVGSYLVLRSEIRDNSGALAQVGKVTYEYCWAKGNYAPSLSCTTGTGTWRRLLAMSVDPIGSRAGFGSCSTPRAIGFRVKYSGSDAIAPGVSAPRDFTWLATA